MPVEMMTRLPLRITGRQIRQGLTGTGAGLHDQMAFFFDCGFNGLRHLQLSATEFVRRVRFRENAARGEKAMERE